MTNTSTLPGIAQRLELEHIARSEFINAMVHLYRGELGEATAWRSRIDTTTHWAVVLSATALSFVFSDKSSERHALIPIITLFCTFLMLMEARRYRFFDIWRSRARMIEINFYRPMLVFYGALVTLGIYSYWVSHIKKGLPAGHPGRLSMVHHEEA